MIIRELNVSKVEELINALTVAVQSSNEAHTQAEQSLHMADEAMASAQMFGGSDGINEMLVITEKIRESIGMLMSGVHELNDATTKAQALKAQGFLDGLM